MTPNLLALATPLITRHEGRRKTVYRDSVGVMTLGIGRNVDSRGLSDDEIDTLFTNDLKLAEGIARYAVGTAVFEALTPGRQAVLLDMAFNLGLSRLLGFHDLLRAIGESRFEDAALAMLASRWAGEVGARAREDAQWMRAG